MDFGREADMETKNEMLRIKDNIDHNVTNIVVESTVDRDNGYLDAKLKSAMERLAECYKEDRLTAMKMEAKTILAITEQMENDKNVDILFS